MLLTSDGLSNLKLRRALKGLLDIPVEQNKVIFLYTKRKGFKKKYLDIVKKRWVSIGFKKKNLKFINISKNVRKIPEFDIIYVCGGNTFYILKRIKKTGLDKTIKKAVNQNKIYVGVSAGSIIPHKTIEIAGWGSEGDVNDIRLKNLRGLNLIKTAILPHYTKKQIEDVREFKKKAKYKIKEIKDGQGILILGKKQVLL